MTEFNFSRPVIALPYLKAAATGLLRESGIIRDTIFSDMKLSRKAG